MNYLPPLISYLPRLWLNTSLSVIAVYYFNLPISVAICFFAFEITIMMLYAVLQLQQHLQSDRNILIGVTYAGIVIASSVFVLLLPNFIEGIKNGGLQAAALLTPFASTLLAHTYLLTSHHLSKKLQQSFITRTGYIFGILAAGLALLALFFNFLDTSYSLEFQLTSYILFKYIIDITLFTILR